MGPKEFYLKHKFNIKDHYDLHETIGEGALSRVRRATHKQSNNIRAVKVVRKADLEFGERRKVLEEIELLKELDHPNIGQVIEMFEDSKKMYFVNEMMQGGSLLERLTQEFVSESHAASIIHQILSAVTYLHTKNIVHGDIKPSNLHFQDVDGENIKLIDFGSCRRNEKDELLHGVYGTSYYVAPEVLEQNGYDNRIDVWSVGVLMYILLSGQPPFDGQTGRDVLVQVKKGNYSL
jgi:calcium-dependent protein kinase